MNEATLAASLLLDGIGRRMRMSKLLGVPTVLVQLLIVVDFVVEGGIVDVQFVRVDSHDWSFLLYLARFLHPRADGSYHILHASSGSPTDTGLL